MPRPRTPEERFNAYVQKTDGCWIWTRSLAKGYGGLFIDSRTRVPAHRWSYEHHVGPIPEGLHIDHLCRNRACVNPAHLEPVTCRENLMRGETHAAKNAAKTHCVNGHEFTPANTSITVRGARRCRRCEADRRALVRRREAAARDAARRQMLAARTCPICGDVLPFTLSVIAVYCSPLCKGRAQPRAKQRRGAA